MGIASNNLEIPIASGPIYEDATYKYFGEAEPGTALNVAKWRVSRLRKSDTYVQWVLTDDVVEFDQVYTDLATVALLPFV